MDSSQHNWLGFSLSNNHQDASQVSQAPGRFETLSSPLNNTPNNIVDAVAAAQDSSAAVFSGGPKLEDFLGGGGGQFSGNAAPVVDASASYESELKRIAASFLRGFSAEQVASGNTSKQVTAGKKAVDTFGQRTSMYRGVTRHRWTGRYEAHLWDNSCRREGQSRKGRQVYLGGYDKEEKAARAYDLAALKYWGPSTTTNFPISNYENEAKEMKNMTRQEFVASLRRGSSGFSRGASKYRGVTRHHQHGRWQARIGRVAGNKDLYLGTFSTQEEAAEAYDIAAIKFRGLNAVTNFDMTRYDVRSIASSNLPVGGCKSRTPSDTMPETGPGNVADDRDFSPAVSSLSFSSPSTSTLSFALPVKHDTPADYWTMLSAYPNQNQYLSMNGAVSVLQTPKVAFGIDFSASYNNNSSVPESGTAALHGVAAGNGSSYVTQAQSHNSGSVTGGGVSVSSNVPFGAPIGLSTSGDCDQVSGNGSWGTVPFHSFQASKPSGVSVFQTPIFGVE